MFPRVPSFDIGFKGRAVKPEEELFCVDESTFKILIRLGNTTGGTPGKGTPVLPLRVCGDRKAQWYTRVHARRFLEGVATLFLHHTTHRLSSIIPTVCFLLAQLVESTQKKCAKWWVKLRQREILRRVFDAFVENAQTNSLLRSKTSCVISRRDNALVARVLLNWCATHPCCGFSFRRTSFVEFFLFRFNPCVRLYCACVCPYLCCLSPESSCCMLLMWLRKLIFVWIVCLFAACSCVHSVLLFCVFIPLIFCVWLCDVYRCVFVFLYVCVNVWCVHLCVCI